MNKGMKKTYHCSGNTKRNRKDCQVTCNVKIVRKFIGASSFKHFSLKSRRGFQPTRRILVTLLAPRGVKVTTFIPRRKFFYTLPIRGVRLTSVTSVCRFFEKERKILPEVFLSHFVFQIFISRKDKY